MQREEGFLVVWVHYVLHDNISFHLLIGNFVHRRMVKSI